MLESYLKSRLKDKGILLMTHIVLGYPSFEDCFKIIETMVNAGVDLMELQIPFSEPIADGPVILHANQESLAGGSTVKKCLDFAQNVTQSFDIPFLFMSYYNILFKYGVDKFAAAMADRSMKGAIVPDLPPEEGRDYLDAMKKYYLDPIFIFSPTTPDERMNYLASFGRGFIYCVARKGVTGLETDFSGHLEKYLERCRRATDLPLALGFGVKDKNDIDFLKGKTDIAVIGSQTIRLVEKEGVGAVGEFIRGLR
ncbi:MAG: tryptophan synthase subunit alpha [Proteobacteria bacterium]|nr:tryptophan synthase subunit alpha [Pseudomonadota bacterium]MBU4288755.1 tryptophan synthase subunit alpha [Pseudomonadota bacterium]MBU4415313.1 tryptophan synthase subunit alpha [Pseudomonadota bacterium]MCG2758304.1 tryptophan synthase subunit alpha [Desulfobacteraceae bacterium]